LINQAKKQHINFLTSKDQVDKIDKYFETIASKKCKKNEEKDLIFKTRKTTVTLAQFPYTLENSTIVK